MAYEELVNLEGTFLPVTTPFDSVTGDVDYATFGANLRRWFGSPIRGILIGGSTGESVNQSFDNPLLFVFEDQRGPVANHAFDTGDAIQHQVTQAVGIGDAHVDD